MKDSITTAYTGADATGEILFMLAIAAILGYLLRWAWEQFMYEEYIIEDDAPAMTAPVVAAPVAAAPVAMPFKQDDLKIVEGIGPKIESLLQEGGVKTWEQLAEASFSQLRGILDQAGERYRIHDPSTWPEQARLAFEHKWTELEEYQDFLSGVKIIG